MKRKGAIGPFFRFVTPQQRKYALPIHWYSSAKTLVYDFALIVRFRPAPHHYKILPHSTQFSDLTGD